MTVQKDLSFSQAVQIFLDHATWLDDSHQVAVTSLEKIAEQLDRRVSAGLLAEQTKLYRLLINARPENPEKDDALDNFLAGLSR